MVRMSRWFTTESRARTASLLADVAISQEFNDLVGEPLRIVRQGAHLAVGSGQSLPRPLS
jgi:hypothetical protein